MEALEQALAWELEEADLKPGDKVTINRDKLNGIARRALEGSLKPFLPSRAAIAAMPQALSVCPHSDGNSCEQYRLQGQRCQDCPLLQAPATDAELALRVANLIGERLQPIKSRNKVLACAVEIVSLIGERQQ